MSRRTIENDLHNKNYLDTVKYIREHSTCFSVPDYDLTPKCADCPFYKYNNTNGLVEVCPLGGRLDPDAPPKIFTKELPKGEFLSMVKSWDDLIETKKIELL